MSARALQDDAILKAPAGSDRTISTDIEAQPRPPARSLPCRPISDSRRRPRPHLLDPDRLPDYTDALFRAAWALCGSRHDAEDLVQETFAAVLKRPRWLRDDNEIGYVLRALRNTYADRYRTAARRPVTRQLFEDDAPSVDESRISAREIMQAIASAPAPHRDAVIAVDLLGLSYREAARSLHTREATITTRLYRGRQHVAGELIAPARTTDPGRVHAHRPGRSDRQHDTATQRPELAAGRMPVGCGQAPGTNKSMPGNGTEEEWP